MNPIRYTLKELKEKTVPIGREGENEYTVVSIDCAEVYEEHPAAVASMKVQNPNKVIYPVVIERSGNDIIWTVKASDLTVKGDGRFQLTFTEGTVIHKTVIGRTLILKSLVADGPVPEAVEDWIDEATELMEDMEEKRDSGYFKGDPGDPGAPGHSPVLTADKVGKTTTIYSDGTQLAQILDGQDGQAGAIIDDTAPAADKVFSSSKVNGELNTVKSALNGIDDIFDIKEVSHKSKNLNVTPYHTTTVNDVTFTVGNDGTVTLSGTPTKNTYWPDLTDTSFRWQLPAGTYTFSAGEDVDNWRSPTLILYATQDAVTALAEYPIGRYQHETETFTVANDCWAAVRYFVDKRNSELSDKFYPQVEAGSEVTSYESPWAQSSETVSGELENRSKPKPVIVDTDIGNDSDDALAVRVLSYFDSIGAIRLLMASCSFNTINALKGISALLNYDGTVNVPIILKNSNYTESTGEYLDTLIAYPFTQSTPKTLYGATAYRKVLAESKEKVNLIFLGPLTNLSDLLDSSADTISDKNGIALVTEKVDKIFVMGGAYPDSVEAMDGNGATIGGVVVPGAEWNFAGDISATANVITNCPVPMIFCGWEIGRAIPCGGGISDKLPQNDAMIAVMNKHGGSSEVTNGRYGYDPITAAVACLDDAGKMGFELVRGTVVYNSTNSTNTFTESDSGNHYYVAKKYDNDYYKMYMNHILAKDWWGANNAVQKGRASL